MKNSTQQIRANGGEAVPPEGDSAAERVTEPTIEQVRDLLFGGARRSLETRLAELHEELRESVSKVQKDFAQELSALQAKVEDLERRTEQERLRSLSDVGKAISELGVTISALGSGRTGQ